MPSIATATATATAIATATAAIAATAAAVVGGAAVARAGPGAVPAAARQQACHQVEECGQAGQGKPDAVQRRRVQQIAAQDGGRQDGNGEQ
jgi:hypothetical protein